MIEIFRDLHISGLGAKIIKKYTKLDSNRTYRAKQYKVTSFLSTDCELSTNPCSENVYNLGPRFAGGGEWENVFPVAAGKDQSQSLNYSSIFYVSGRPADHPPFLETHGHSGRLGRSAYAFKQRNNISSLQKKNIYQKFGGPMAPVIGPRGPPPGYATGHISTNGHLEDV